MNAPRVALCLPGGGATGAMYQIGALAALEHAVEGLQVTELDLYLGASTGATVAAALAGGLPVERLYRALLDPADVYFPLERQHVLRTDLDEWRQTLVNAWQALGQGARSLVRRSRQAPPTPAQLWEELDRFSDALPPGVFSLEGYERFLEDFFVRRGVPNAFSRIPRPLRVLAFDLDSGQPAVFGGAGLADVPIARACAASMAVPPFFSPVRIGDRHYFDAGAAQLALLDVAVAEGAELVVVVNPMVPVDVDRVPTGHGRADSLRAKGLLWVTNQAIRIGMHHHLTLAAERIRARGQAEVLLIEPEPSDGELFMHSSASFAARREILEFAYRATRNRVSHWLAGPSPRLARAGWRTRAPASVLPPPPPGPGGGG